LNDDCERDKWVDSPFLHEPEADSTNHENNPTERREYGIPNTITLDEILNPWRKNKIKKIESPNNLKDTYERN
jgi:hypothetical protein